MVNTRDNLNIVVENRLKVSVCLSWFLVLCQLEIMGAISSNHHAKYDPVRFNEALTFLKSFKIIDLSDELAQKYYDTIDEGSELNNEEVVEIYKYQTYQELIVDHARYYLTHYKIGTSSHVIRKCSDHRCKWDPADQKMQIHYILFHPSCYVLCTIHIELFVYNVVTMFL